MSRPRENQPFIDDPPDRLIALFAALHSVYAINSRIIAIAPRISQYLIEKP